MQKKLKAQALLALVPVLCFATQSVVEAAGPKKPQKKKRLTLVSEISKAQKALDKASATVSTARQTIEATGLFGKTYLVVIEKSKIDEVVAGAKVYGAIRVVRGSAERYKTAEERQTIADMSNDLKLLQAAKSDSIKLENDRFAKIDDKTARHKIHHRQELRRINAEYDRKIKELKRSLDEAGKQLRAVASRRSEQSEIVNIEVQCSTRFVVPKDWHLKSKLKLMTKVVEYQVGQEPDEIGGAPRVESLVLELVEPKNPKSS